MSLAASYSIAAIFSAKDRLSPAIDKISRNYDSFGGKVGRTLSILNRKTNQLFKGLGTAAIAGFGLATAAITLFVKEASKIEDATAAFTPLMGSVERANKLVAELNKTAASTPFQFENISAAAKQLLPVMNQDIERTIKTFRMLGDTAGGNAQKLDSITRGFTKSLLKGKVDMESLNMIAEAGVPIYS